MFWTLIRSELALWAAKGKTAQLWWRDDDARAPSHALDRLLAISSAYEVPLTLAVIPDSRNGALARRLKSQPLVSVAQHGAHHQNRIGVRRPSEFPADVTLGQISKEISSGWRRVSHLPRALKVFVPPWNAVHPLLREALCREGFVAWSAFGGGRIECSLPRFDADLDILTWGRRPRFAGEARALLRLYDLLRTRRRAGRWDEPLGLLTHHMDMDEDAWAFLGRFLAETRRHKGATWRGLPDFVTPVAHWPKILLGRAA